MFFLLRIAFWLTVIFAALPIFVPHGERPVQTAATRFDAGDAFSAATATVSDLGQFCTRRADACEVGAQALAAVGESAQTGIKIVLEYLREKSAADATHVIARKRTVERNSGEKSAGRKSTDVTADRATRETLQPADLEPGWRGPRADGAADPKHPA